jgi:hypothetical protein
MLDYPNGSLAPSQLSCRLARSQAGEEAALDDLTLCRREPGNRRPDLLEFDRRRGKNVGPVRLGLALDERPFTVAEAAAAEEAFVTSASQIVLPVVRIDGTSIGNGVPGPVAAALRREFHHHAEFS